MKQNKFLSRLITLAIATTMCLVIVPTVNADCPTDMVAYWKLDEGTGSIAYDETTNDNDGELSGGKFGNALEFDGTDDYVNFGNDPSLDIYSTWTISMWVKWQSSSQTYQTLFNKENPKTSEGWDIAYSAWIYSNGLYFGMNDADRVWHQDAHMGTIPEDTWTHVAVTFDGTDARSYINGAHTDTLTIGKIGWANNANLLIGKRHNSVEIFKGRIDEFAIYNRDLSSQEILDYFNSDAEHILHIDLISLWHFDESVGTITYDETSNNNDGIIYGATWAGPTWTTGKIGNALKFDGVDDYVNIPDDNSLSFGDGVSTDSPFSISAWVYMESSIIKQRFVSKADSFNPADGEYLLTTDFMGRFGFFLTDKSLGSYPFIGRRWSVLPSTNQWYYVVGTYDGSGSSSGINLYVDGVQVDDTDDSRPYEEMENTNKPLYLGKYGSDYLDGMIDEVAIFGRELSADEISNFYCLGENFGVGYCESPTLTYTGTPLLYDSTQPITLEATLTDSTGTTPMQGHSVYFYIDESTTPVGNDMTDSNGIASIDLGTKIAGVYKVTASVYCIESDPAFIVVYDPSAGFVTGGGWINSPAGAYVADPSAEGKANFGFVSKYKKGQSTPDGNTEFQFKAGDLNFHSTEYDWLVIAHHKAMYKGTGTINGDGNYGFMISAIDEKLTPSTDVDLFRIKIWDKNNGDAVVYDNQLGNPDDSDPTTAISGGQIKIHSG